MTQEEHRNRCMKMMKIEPIATNRAPSAIGPYSQAIKANGMIFTSGQIPINPATKELVAGTIEEQTRLVLDNLQVVLEAAGTDLAHVVKTTVFLKNMEDFPKVNGVYSEYFPVPCPARSCVEVARLPRDVSVEIEAVAVLP